MKSVFFKAARVLPPCLSPLFCVCPYVDTPGSELDTEGEGSEWVQYWIQNTMFTFTK